MSLLACAGARVVFYGSVGFVEIGLLLGSVLLGPGAIHIPQMLPFTTIATVGYAGIDTVIINVVSIVCIVFIKQ